LIPTLIQNGFFDQGHPGDGAIRIQMYGLATLRFSGGAIGGQKTSPQSNRQ